MKSTILALALAATASASHAQSSIVINEVMQSNIDYLMVDNDFPDSWVELYNPTSRNVNVGGYIIGEKEDPTRGYKLPAGTSVPANGHLVIYCDKEGHGLHADFRVDSGKASLYLFNSSGTVVDHLEMTDMPDANIAYGRVTDGADEWQYEIAPTAGAANAGGGAAELLPEPIFSVDGGLYNSSFPITITMPEGVPEDAKIYVTVDGTEPTLESRGAKDFTVMVSRNMTFRAKIMSASGAGLSPRSSVRSFIFHPRETNLPVVSIVSDRNYFYSSDNGIFSGAVNDGTPNYMRKWRRPINIEYFDTESGKVIFNQLGETAVSGVSTREEILKSMKVYANKRFGKKTYKGAFWEDKPEVKKVKSFVLRNGGNNSMQARVNDAAVQKTFGTHVDNLDWQAYRPVIVYLNGTFLGEFGMRERADEDYVEANYPDMGDVEFADETSYQTPTPGSLFADFHALYHRNDVTYDELAAQMDMDNFLKTLVAEVYAKNTDFPTNNVAMWRPVEDGGKWRWILKDMDRFGMNLMLFPPEFNMLRFMFTPDDIMFQGMKHFDLYKKMISFPEFREPFIDRLAVNLGDFLRPELVNALIDNMDAEINDELKATFTSVNVKFSQFTSATKYLKTTVEQRPGYLYAQMADYFKLGKVLGMKVVTNGVDVSINDVALTEGDFNGSFFSDRQLRLSSATKGAAWKMKVTHSDGNVTETDFSTPDVALCLSDYMDSPTDLISVEFETVDVPEIAMKGDVNGDQKVDVADAVSLINLCMAKLKANANYDVCDLDSDGNIDFSDAMEILYIYLMSK